MGDFTYLNAAESIATTMFRRPCFISGSSSALASNRNYTGYYGSAKTLVRALNDGVKGGSVKFSHDVFSTR